MQDTIVQIKLRLFNGLSNIYFLREEDQRVIINRKNEISDVKVLVINTFLTEYCRNYY